MRRNILALLVVSFLLALAGAVVSPAPCPAAGRDRALERTLGDGYAADEAGQIGRAFRAAVQGGVRERTASGLVESCVEGEFSAEQIVRVLSLAAQLALEDLPVDSFADKLEEGTAKGVPAERVLQAAEARALTLNQAKGAVNAAVLDGLEVRDRGELIGDVAGALEGGQDVAEVGRILRLARDEGWSQRNIRRALFP